MPAPKKQSRLKTKANLKKFILLTRFIKKWRLKIPTKKLEIKAGHASINIIGSFKSK